MPATSKRFLSMTTSAIASAIALASTSEPAAAQQDAVEPRGTLKFEVTGSHILRSEAESALPVQVITREDIARSGSTTVAELMSKVSANILGFNDQLSVGDQLNPRPRSGLSSVNLRGVGDGSTLVLINGRRVANYAFDGGPSTSTRSRSAHRPCRDSEGRRVGDLRH
jgi:iron complex outermembrane receptor protein